MAIGDDKALGVGSKEQSMRVLISEDKAGNKVWLTTDTPEGNPILRIEAEACEGDFAPQDLVDEACIGEGIYAGVVLAAYLIVRWAYDARRKPWEREIARQYLSQWPEGPQLQGV